MDVCSLFISMEGSWTVPRVCVSMEEGCRVCVNMEGMA